MKAEGGDMLRLSEEEILKAITDMGFDPHMEAEGHVAGGLEVERAIAESQLRHAMEKVREFMADWNRVYLCLPTDVPFRDKYGVAWCFPMEACFDSWLSHELKEG